jgi:hypothetical protein
MNYHTNAYVIGLIISLMTAVVNARSLGPAALMVTKLQKICQLTAKERVKFGS